MWCTRSKSWLEQRFFKSLDPLIRFSGAPFVVSSKCADHGFGHGRTRQATRRHTRQATRRHIYGCTPVYMIRTADIFASKLHKIQICSHQDPSCVPSLVSVMMSFTERESHDAAMGRFYDASADFWRLRILCTEKFQFSAASRSKTINENLSRTGFDTT